MLITLAVVLLSSQAPAFAAEPRAVLVQKRVCLSCHRVEADAGHSLGPNLWGLAQRNIGSAEGFEYSDAFKIALGQWNEKSLDTFLANPMQTYPGTFMAFPGIDKAEVRAGIIDWLGTLNDPPADWSASHKNGDRAKED
ncbi:MAG: hypothetical protein Tsb002_37130 [Wenzhouxiangellaceae bacterium]